MHDAKPSDMATLTLHHGHIHERPIGLRAMDFVLLAILAVALAFMAQSDKAPVRVTDTPALAR